jgi:uncharacterized membrane protein
MASFWDSVFEFLFKYRPLVWEKGEVVLSAPWPYYLAVLALAALAVPSLLRYRQVSGKTTGRDRTILTAVRIAVLATVVFCLFRPALVVSTVVPQRSFVGLLFDDSRSMQIADEKATPRGALLGELFGPEGSTLSRGLAERFKLRSFRFSSTAERVNGVEELTFAGSRSYLGEPLERAREELGAVPLAGLVLFTDGADNSDGALTDTLLSLKARGVPVFTVGLGRERFTRDIELTRVVAPRSVLEGSSLVVDVSVAQRGFSGSRVRLDVEDGGRIVNSQEVELPAEGEAGTVRVHFTASESGPRLFTFRIAPQQGEMVTQNNSQQALILVEQGRQKILYLEGEPRFEVGFMRRAVAEDKNLQLVCLQRTAENKFLRLGVDNPEDLLGGFPKTREDLYRFQGIILGSVEASFFTLDQLRMIGDFVSQRGGGLLALGGRHAFAEGGYAGTPVADILPVVLEPREVEEPYFAELRVELTPFGMTHPVTRLGANEAENAKRWAALPPLSTFNPIGRLKPGATPLLTGASDSLRVSRQVVLAYQRYGRGKALTFTVQDSWQWQMHADMALEDMTHETLWRQLLRWLVSYVPGPVTVGTARDRFAPGERVTVMAEVDDDTYLKVNNAEVRAEVKGPSGELLDLPMEWTVEKDGEYRTSFVPEEKGLYQIRVEARRSGETLGTGVAYVEATELASEYFGAEMRAGLLKRIAEETGGRFYTPATVATLPEDLSYTEGGTTVLEERDLWDMPAIFLLLLALVAVEWSYRKVRGLA